jgi:hypothetical protein
VMTDDLAYPSMLDRFISGQLPLTSLG